MTIYNNRGYRKIYEDNFGSIPVDSTGRTYDIHHLNGDHSDSDILNLKCVTIQEHYDIHYSQGDWGACNAIALRMGKTPEELSILASIRAKARVADGTHHFLKEGFAERVNQKRIENGTHNLLGPGHNKALIASGVHHFIGKNNPVHKLLDSGTHNFLGDRNPSKQRAAAGTHLFQKEWKCQHCGITGKGFGNYKRWHGAKCKFFNDIIHE